MKLHQLRYIHEIASQGLNVSQAAEILHTSQSEVRIAVAAGEVFQVLITYRALHDLELNLVDSVWVQL